MCMTRTMCIIRTMSMTSTMPAGTGVSSGLAILSSLFTRTNFHVEDTLLGAYNIMTYGAPKIW